MCIHTHTEVYAVNGYWLMTKSDVQISSIWISIYVEIYDNF